MVKAAAGLLQEQSWGGRFNAGCPHPASVTLLCGQWHQCCFFLNAPGDSKVWSGLRTTKLINTKISKFILCDVYS